MYVDVSLATRGGQQPSKLNSGYCNRKWKVTFTGHLISLFCHRLGLWCCFSASHTLTKAETSLLLGKILLRLRDIFMGLFLYSWLDGWFHKPAVILRLNVGSQEIPGPVYDYCLTVLFFYLFIFSCNGYMRV